MEEFPLGSSDYIPLDDLLKATGLCGSGGLARNVIADGRVRVDGHLELRKRCKIRRGQTVDYDGRRIMVR